MRNTNNKSYTLIFLPYSSSFKNLSYKGKLIFLLKTETKSSILVIGVTVRMSLFKRPFHRFFSFIVVTLFYVPQGPKEGFQSPETEWL